MRPQASKRSPRELAFVGLVLSSITLAGGPPAAQAQDAPPAPLASDATLEGLDELHRQLDELRHRAQGMEGKLRESAIARKTADQGRMDAERQLAERSQALEASEARLEAALDAQAELERRLSDHQSLIGQLEAQLVAAQTERQAIEGHLKELRARVPEEQGGTLTAEQARASAAETYAELRKHLETEDDRLEPPGDTVAAAMAARLGQSQRRLADATEAQCVYRVRPRDSLASISSRFYGIGSRWRELFDANRHILESPDQLTPGMPLVIP